jgi:hypothetical protein
MQPQRSFVISKKGMEILLNKKLRDPKVKPFILLNEYCQVYCGLKRGYPAFSDDLDDARTLENDEQVKNIQYGTSFKLEKEYL